PSLFGIPTLFQAQEKIAQDHYHRAAFLGGLLVPIPDSVSTVEEAGDPLLQDPEERKRSAEGGGFQNKSKGDPQHHLLEKKQQKSISGTKWKRENESFPQATVAEAAHNMSQFQEQKHSL
ncbi:UNVERIFIED_CONTAM: hypothetical protein K2H54_063531, partial [Gekko kuhli]